MFHFHTRFIFTRIFHVLFSRNFCTRFMFTRFIFCKFRASFVLTFQFYTCPFLRRFTFTRFILTHYIFNVSFSQVSLPHTFYFLRRLIFTHCFIFIHFISTRFNSTLRFKMVLHSQTSYPHAWVSWRFTLPHFMVTSFTSTGFFFFNKFHFFRRVTTLLLAFVRGFHLSRNIDFFSLYRLFFFVSLTSKCELFLMSDGKIFVGLPSFDPNSNLHISNFSPAVVVESLRQP